MALVSPASGEQLLILFGNAATPEVFSASCTINTTRSVDLTATASTTELADCVTPSNPATVVRQIKSVDLKFTGAGIADAPSILALIEWNRSGAVKDVQVIQNLTGAQGGWTAVGQMVFTSMNLAGARGDKQTFTGTFEQANAFTFTANP